MSTANTAAFANVVSAVSSEANPEGTALAAFTPVIGDTVHKYGGMMLMMPLMIFSIILILIGITVFSVDKNKVPGAMITIFAMMLGGGVFYMMRKTSDVDKAK